MTTSVQRMQRVGIAMSGVLLALLGFFVVFPQDIAGAGMVGPGRVEGVVTQPSGASLTASSQVKLYRRMGSPTSYWYEYITSVQSIPASGSFTIDTVAANLAFGEWYALAAYPPTGSPYTHSVWEEFYLATPTSVESLGQVKLTYPRVRGKVVLPDGSTRPLQTGWVNMSRNAHSEGDGYGPLEEYAIGGLPAGVYQLQAQPPSEATEPLYMSVPITVVVAPDSQYLITSTQEITIRLTYAQLVGAVYAPDGETRVNGWVQHVDPPFQGSGTSVVRWFAFGNLAPGELYRFQASPSSGDTYGPSSIREFWINNLSVYDPNVTQVVSFTLTGIQLKGHILAPGASERVSGTVYVVTLDNEYVTSEWTPGGSTPYRVSNVPDGTYRVVAVPDQAMSNVYFPSPAEEVVFTSPIQTQYLSMSLTLPQIQGVVLNPEGSGRADAWVALFNNRGEWVAGDETTATRGFAFGNQPPGEYALVAYPQSVGEAWESLPYSVTIGAGPTEPVTLTLRGTNLVGRVLFSNESPAQSATVRVTSPFNEEIDEWAHTDENGEFALGGLPAGNYTIYYYPPTDVNEFGGSKPFSIEPIQKTDVGDLRLEEPTAEIHTILVDEDGDIVTDALAAVGAYGQNDESVRRILDDGYASLGVKPGEWWVDYWVAADSGYAVDYERSGPRTVVITQTGTIVTETLGVIEADATISGWVTSEPSNHSIDWTGVKVFAISVDDPTRRFYTHAGDSGGFQLDVPTGKYVVGADVPRESLPYFLPPVRAEVNAPAMAVALEFRVREEVRHDIVYITGTLTLSPPDPDASVMVAGWAPHVGYVTTTLKPDGTYSLPVVGSQTGMTWTLWAAAENRTTGEAYRGQPRRLLVSLDTIADVNFLLTRDEDVLPPRQCFNFDPRGVRYINLPPENENLPPVVVAIPANALPVPATDTSATFCATPSVAVPGGQDLVGFVYEMDMYDQRGARIHENFARPLRITFYYDDTGMSTEEEAAIVPAFYSPERDDWEPLTNVTRDTDVNFVTGLAEHFSKIGGRFLTGDTLACYDFNSDGQSSVADIQAAAAAWGRVHTDAEWIPRYDLDGDGDVDTTDVVIAAETWGVTCQ